MAYEFNRNLTDANYVSTVAIAQGGANSATFDLEQSVGGDIANVVLEIAGPTAAGISDTKVITYTVKDSADGVTFAVLDPTIVTTQTGAGGAGITAKTVRVKLPPIARRYVRVEQTASATSGTFSGNMVVKLLF